MVTVTEFINGVPEILVKIILQIPGDMPVIKPEEETTAILVLLEVHGLEVFGLIPVNCWLPPTQIGEIWERELK